MYRNTSLCIVVRKTHERQRIAHPNAKLLIELAVKRLLKGFIGMNFSTGKFPQAAAMPTIIGPPRDKDVLRTIDQNSCNDA